MIWIIANREFLSNVITLRFLIGLVVCLLLIISSTYVAINDYNLRQAAYDRSAISNAEFIKNVKVFSRLDTRYHGVYANRQASKLSFLCIGSDRTMGSLIHFGYDQVPVEAMEGSDSDPLGADSLMVVFSSLDTILIIQVIISLLTLLFAYNAISGERERGTLSQVLSNSVPRYQILMGKFAGGMMSVSLPMLLGLLASLIVIWFSGDVVLKASDWVRIGLILLASLLYVSFFFTLSLLISSLTERSATSLVLLLFLWVFFVIIVPNMGPYVAKQVRAIPDRVIVDNKSSALREEMYNKIGIYGQKLWQEGTTLEKLKAYQGGTWGIHSGDSPYLEVIEYGTKENMQWYLAGAKYWASTRLQYADIIWALYREYNDDLERQLSLARLLSRMSPAWVYYNASAILSLTDVGNYLKFMDQARRYRQNLIDYTRVKGGFSTLLYITRMTMEDAPTTAEAEEMVKNLGRAEYERRMRKNAKPFSDIPLFQYKPEDATESLARALPDLAILAILNSILFIAAYVSFMRGRIK